MKKIILIAFISLIGTLEGRSQNLEVGFGLGTGSAYTYENFDSSVDINYSLPFSSYLDLKYSNTESYFGLKLKFQYLNAGIEGRNWKNNNEPIDGDVTSLTSMILLEHLKEDNTWNFGYNFGFGYTHQEFRQNLNILSPGITSNYMSVNFSGIISSKLTEDLALQIEPTLFWTDPVGSLRASDKWQIAGEDINILLQLGIKYKIN
ncbi:hypothetical protein RM545_10205 [Zunongwangia sp. F260]|uniref:Outer membrane protein beta-barrel domain-containing protein n=1 Tax=Autumnicola lenta TaxID=3075593 RepID=A0ABU3CL27_9FLAO|nr:hypothetical protein [Zunongwangia sp. F260]MDT0647064.1 hypothetical protein [Zunongwangia sp. F260]